MSVFFFTLFKHVDEWIQNWSIYSHWLVFSIQIHQSRMQLCYFYTSLLNLAFCTGLSVAFDNLASKYLQERR